jgi:hypothetical protein
MDQTAHLSYLQVDNNFKNLTKLDLLNVGDIPNRYTSDVVLIQQARVAHQGWYGGFAIPGGPVAEVATAVLDAGAYGGSGDSPWRVTSGEPVADPDDSPWRVTL